MPSRRVAAPPARDGAAGPSRLALMRQRRAARPWRAAFARRISRLFIFIEWRIQPLRAAFTRRIGRLVDTGCGRLPPRRCGPRRGMHRAAGSPSPLRARGEERRPGAEGPGDEPSRGGSSGPGEAPSRRSAFSAKRLLGEAPSRRSAFSAKRLLGEAPSSSGEEPPRGVQGLSACRPSFGPSERGRAPVDGGGGGGGGAGPAGARARAPLRP